MDTIKGTVLEVGNDHENVFHITVEAQIPEGVARVQFNVSRLGENPNINVPTRMPDEPFRFIATTIGEPALKVGDFIAIEVFYHNEILPDPNKPTHVVSMDAFTSPKWAHQEKFTEVIRQLCVPCKEHGVYPVVGEQLLNVAKDRLLGTGKLTVHCPNKECKFFVENYDPAKWNQLIR
jgi:hypothetical protein